MEGWSWITSCSTCGRYLVCRLPEMNNKLLRKWKHVSNEEVAPRDHRYRSHIRSHELTTLPLHIIALPVDEICIIDIWEIVPSKHSRKITKGLSVRGPRRPLIWTYGDLKSTAFKVSPSLAISHLAPPLSEATPSHLPRPSLKMSHQSSFIHQSLTNAHSSSRTCGPATHEEWFAY